ncbi:hypothetical protein [Streptomyces sp. NPDC058745]|uniref:hypothetical protein n=1 Tax=Streptomyces sp. NPDC058745 TaxID=3346621 RepID=UPI003684EF72
MACTQSRNQPVPDIDADIPLQYDARVLHLLGHDYNTIADATGCAPSTIRYLIAPHALRAHQLLISC